MTDKNHPPLSFISDTRKREVNGLLAISRTLSADNLVIVTKDEEHEMEYDGKTIHVLPLWKWLLQDTPLPNNNNTTIQAHK